MSVKISHLIAINIFFLSSHDLETLRLIATKKLFVNYKFSCDFFKDRSDFGLAMVINFMEEALKNENYEWSRCEKYIET